MGILLPWMQCLQQLLQVEEVRNPALRDVPLGVTQKYLIVTANYPASAVHAAQAARRCA